MLLDNDAMHGGLCTVNPEYFVCQNFCTLVGQNISYACYMCMEDTMYKCQAVALNSTVCALNFHMRMYLQVRKKDVARHL